MKRLENILASLTNLSGKCYALTTRQKTSRSPLLKTIGGNASHFALALPPSELLTIQFNPSRSSDIDDLFQASCAGRILMPLRNWSRSVLPDRVMCIREHCQLKTLRDILSWERCGSCARLGRGHFPPDRE